MCAKAHMDFYTYENAQDASHSEKGSGSGEEVTGNFYSLL